MLFRSVTPAALAIVVVLAPSNPFVRNSCSAAIRIFCSLERLIVFIIVLTNVFNNIVNAKLGMKFLLCKFLCQFFSVFFCEFFSRERENCANERSEFGRI